MIDNTPFLVVGETRTQAVVRRCERRLAAGQPLVNLAGGCFHPLIFGCHPNLLGHWSGQCSLVSPATRGCGESIILARRLISVNPAMTMDYAGQVPLNTAKGLQK